ncbi:MAG: hypothetical protein IJL87_09930 [Clostridia bacterium]|nr:hypothetical protein [Clostridia bacterium]
MNNYRNYSRKKSFDLLSGEGIQRLCIIYIVIWAIFPPFYVGSIFRLAALGCMGLWLIFTFQKIKLSMVNILSFIYLGIVVSSTVLLSGTSAIIKQIAVILLVLLLLVHNYYNGKWQDFGKVILVFLALFIFSNIMTTRELVIDPHIARAMVRDDASLYRLYRRGVGGYSLIYGQVCISPVVVQWTLKNRKRNPVKFGFGVAWILSFVMLIFNAGYSIAIFGTVVSTFMMFFYRRKNSTMAVVLAITILFLAMYAIVKYEWLQEFLLKTFDGTVVTKKVNDLVESARNGEAEGSIAVRLECYLASINTFFNYPFTGGWLWDAGGGGHSAVMDSLANYGILGGGIFTYMLVYAQFAKYKYTKDKTLRRTVNAAITAIMTVAVLDTIPYEIVTCIMMIIPLLLSDIGEKKENILNEGTLDSKFNTL